MKRFLKVYYFCLFQVLPTSSPAIHNNNPTKADLASEPQNAITFRDAYYSYGKKVPVLVSIRSTYLDIILSMFLWPGYVLAIHKARVISKSDGFFLNTELRSEFPFTFLQRGAYSWSALSTFVNISIMLRIKLQKVLILKLLRCDYKYLQHKSCKT